MEDSRNALRAVYAIETRPGFFVPRSQAMDTSTMPRLWASKRDAEMMMRKEAPRCSADGFPRIVKFRLVELHSAEEGER